MGCFSLLRPYSFTSYSMKENNAARLVSAAILGKEIASVVVNGRRYVIHPPTIKKLAGAGLHLAPVSDMATIADLLTGQTDLREMCAALSWLIDGSDALTDELSNGTVEEVLHGLTKAYSLVSVQSFMMLSALARNVAGLIAKQRR